ncbi:hypothetical protein A2Y85_05045 [candidate division WOR-3 bacterium RBG_13_43_14]|uniref:Uncharacterized protein n=1 Tax=candidate division WOR-3 bacterium RBG_13_43_14 TaxID=1802590 RepID=A0A1F4UGH9_UNCW3|nr:MAG: hypothetical protein A2Y85_05045 [candidate division WOR-3 bacterium RBG_13_43_14]
MLVIYKCILLTSLLLVSVVNAQNPIDVNDIVFKIGPESEKSWQYRFAAGDTIILQAKVVKGKCISELSVQEWPSALKYQGLEINEIEKRIYVPTAALYTFAVKNNMAFQERTYQLNIQRIPASPDKIEYNTTAMWDTLYDTTYVAAVETTVIGIDTTFDEIINTQKKIGSQMSGDFRSFLQIDIPLGTKYWAYWIGVGQDASEGLQSMAQNLGEGAATLGIVNPVAAFALGLVPKLFTLNQGHDITYYFIADYSNLQLFLNSQMFYLIKQGQRIITDYSKMTDPVSGTIYLGLDNSFSQMTSKTVTISIVAVKFNSKMVFQNIQKPKVSKKIIPKLD